ncbi:MAG: formylglycine-generating enzyme family protein [Planctomycetota bacterium]
MTTHFHTPRLGRALTLATAAALSGIGVIPTPVHAQEACESCCTAIPTRLSTITANPDTPAEPINAEPQAPAGMVFIPAGEFTMGTDAPNTWPNEQPPHRVRLDGFWIDATEVTNAQFAAFVQATGYVTVAERAIDWEELRKQAPPGTPKPPDAMLAPGSVVFSPPKNPVPLNNFSAWWRWTPGANWRQPAGPGSSLDGKNHHPVVHIAWEDAAAYAQWAGKQLPTEAQWEYAAKGGNDTARFAWGDTFKPQGQTLANTWDGQFPHNNTLDDGHVLTAPVQTYPANGYGLYDMMGNVWEWTADYYREQRHAELAQRGLVVNPQGPATAADPANRGGVSRVVKGGSFLCHVDYCESYRPSARRGLPADTSLQHTGFRCVWTPPPHPPSRSHE